MSSILSRFTLAQLEVTLLAILLLTTFLANPAIAGKLTLIDAPPLSGSQLSSQPGSMTSTASTDGGREIAECHDDQISEAGFQLAVPKSGENFGISQLPNETDLPSSLHTVGVSSLITLPSPPPSFSPLATLESTNRQLAHTYLGSGSDVCFRDNTDSKLNTHTNYVKYGMSHRSQLRELQ